MLAAMVEIQKKNGDGSPFTDVDGNIVRIAIPCEAEDDRVGQLAGSGGDVGGTEISRVFYFTPQTQVERQGFGDNLVLHAERLVPPPLRYSLTSKHVRKDGMVVVVAKRAA